MRAIIAATIAGVVCSVPLSAQTISGDEILGHIKVVADDAMEGRGTGSPGERRAAAYIEEQFKKAGLRPAGGGAYIQEVPLVGVTADPATVLTFEGPSTQMTAAYFEEFVASSGVIEEEVAVDAELVFVGYGVAAPEQGWDDFKGLDVKGKVLLAFVNDPPSDNPKHFGGRAMTYYGRWTYKYEEAARRGAAGILLVHMDEKAGYPWQVVQKSWTGELFQIEGRQDPLRLRGWLRRDVAERLVGLSGKHLDELLNAAARSDFAPTPLGIRVTTRIANKIRKLSAPNVAGVLPGSERPDRFICLVAHHDHFGIGRPDATGDAIYNGALDNGTGVGAVIALAKALGAAKPKDSILFLTVTGEEQGLLGSHYYALHPLTPMAQTTAAISLDGLNVHGRTTDFRALGAEHSGLGRLVSEVVSSMGLTLEPDAHPERGSFFRSDHFSFARLGVPGISVDCGDDYVGKPAGWGEAKGQAYLAQRYHQPSDEIDPDWDTQGLVQVSEVVMKLVARIGEENGLIAWNPDSEFQRQ